MSQSFFSMRQPNNGPDREFLRRPLRDDERKALADALNPFARKNDRILGFPTIQDRLEYEMAMAWKPQQ